MSEKIKSIYLAGKMDDPVNGWRNKIVGKDLEVKLVFKEEHPELMNEGENNFNPININFMYSLQYNGPFFVKDMVKPGDFILKPVTEEIFTFEQFQETYQSIRLNSILQADLVFVWLDDPLDYQTIVDITFADAHGKRIGLASNKLFPELWPVYSLRNHLTRIYEDNTPAGALESLVVVLNSNHEYEQTLKTLSPIELPFFYEWVTFTDTKKGINKGKYRLEPQYPLFNGKYRLDFAHLETKVAIELDGLEAHRTTEQIAHDRKRQREIEREGWRFIRFGGKEIYNDVSACVVETKAFIDQLLGDNK